MTFDPQMISLLMDLRRRGIQDTKILAAFERIPRDFFVPEQFLEQAYEDIPFPISDSQIMLPPYVMAEMIDALSLTDRCKVLEIGTGTGYCTALLSKLARRVYTVEIDRDLWIDAERRFKALDLHTVMSQWGDGLKGWEAQAPFDRIIVHGALTEIPETLLAQLGDKGIMLVAIGESDFDQKLVKIEKDLSHSHGEQITKTKLKAVKFSPLVTQEAVAIYAENGL